MDTMQQRLAELSPEQRRLVEQWLRSKQDAPAPTPPGQIPRRAAADETPLSFAQQRFWLLHQIQPDSPAYNMRTVARLAGRIDLRAFAHSINASVQRHEILRTTFAVEDGRPIQRVAPRMRIPTPLVALDRLPPDAREAQIQILAQQETEQPFDLARGPLLRVLLLRMADDEHVLLMTIHHIISDGWSQGIHLQELIAHYAARLAGARDPLPPLPIQYADYALWQRHPSQMAKMNQQLAYWKARLGRTPHVLDLPTDRPRPALATDRGAWDYFTLSAALIEQLHALSRRSGATLFMILLAAFDILLCRYSGQTDIVIGVPTAGRNRIELEGQLGCFMNMLALRADLAGNPSFRELLQRVRAATLDAYAHQDAPFAQVAEALQLERDPSRSPVFQVMFNFQNAPLPAFSSAGLSMSLMEIAGTTALLDLSLYLRERADELLIRTEYNTDLFEPTTIRRMLIHFRTLLEEIVADPDRPIAALPILPAEQRSQIPLVAEALDELWANMLGGERSAGRAALLDDGGRAAKAAQLGLRIRETFRVNLPARSLFSAPTTAAMAELIIAREARPGQSEQIARTLKRLREMPAADRQRALEQKRRAHREESR